VEGPQVLGEVLGRPRRRASVAPRGAGLARVALRLPEKVGIAPVRQRRTDPSGIAGGLCRKALEVWCDGCCSHGLSRRSVLRNVMPGVACPPGGPVGLSAPPAQVLCSAKTAPGSSPAPSLVARVPIPCLFLCVRGVPLGLVLWSTLPDSTRAFDHPVPQSGHGTRSPVALPRARATPLDACPTPSPAGCPHDS